MASNVSLKTMYTNIKGTTSTPPPVYEIVINWSANWWSFVLTTLTSIPYCFIFYNIYRQKYTKRINFRMGNMAVAGFLVGWLACLKFSEGKTALVGPKTCPAYGFITDVCWTVIGLSAFALNHERMRELGLFMDKMPPICLLEVGCLWAIVEYKATNYVEKDGDCVFMLLGLYTKIFHLIYETLKTLMFHGYISMRLLCRKSNYADMLGMVKPRRPFDPEFRRSLHGEKRELFNIALNSWRYFTFAFVAMWIPIGILDLTEKFALKYEIVQEYIIYFDLMALNWALKQFFLSFIPLGLIFVETRFGSYRNWERAMEAYLHQLQSPTPFLRPVEREMYESRRRIDVRGLPFPPPLPQRCSCLSLKELDRTRAVVKMTGRGPHRSKSCPIIMCEAETQT